MLEQVRIQSFQSLHDVTLDLGKFTVVVGDSSVGKSAVVRALNALVFNIQGNSHVTYGHPYATVTATLTDWIVSIERGEGRSVYSVTNRLTGEVLPPFAKLNKGVPDFINEILNMNTTNFAGQFDAPFLLTSPGSHVARVLGDLTNVSTIHEAVQAGNKKRDRLASELKTRQADLDSILVEMEKFQDLPLQVSRVEALETSLSVIETLSNKTLTLSRVVAELRDADKVLQTIKIYTVPPKTDDVDALVVRRSSLSRMVYELQEAQDVLNDFSEYPEVPDWSDIAILRDKYTELSTLILGLENAIVMMKEAQSTVKNSESLEQEYDERIHSLLLEAGKCPTCNQSVV